MSYPQISKDTFSFLKSLEGNNNREWFNDHKTDFKLHEKNVKTFFEQVMENLGKHDAIERMKMFRIYRDVRFSKDKSPYKTHLAGSFTREGARLRGGYYLHLKPNDSLVATGFWQPNKDDLHRIRKELEVNAEEFRQVVNGEKLKGLWGELMGEELKTAPKGFDKQHPDIDLIRKKQYIFVKKFSDAEVFSKDFAEKVDEAYKGIRPFFDLMSDILTTDLNGESLLD
ncbi:MAG: DUF2461 domain-containing protein [Flavobacteriaceae bacterium]